MSSLICEIVKIENIEPIEKADKLEVVTVKGWHCVVSKQQYQIGSLVIYCPPDSIIPEKLIEKYNLEFLKKNNRVGTIKLRGQINEGLILDLDCLPPMSCSKKWLEGKDVAEVLGITKWEPPTANYSLMQKRETFKTTFQKLLENKITFRRFIFKCFGLVKDKFKKRKKLNPFFDVYTDIENIKNYPSVFQDGEEVVITEKIHGTSTRYANLPLVRKTRSGLNRLNFFNFCIKNTKQEFCFGSHKVQLTGKTGKNCWYREDVYGKIAERLNLAEKLPLGYVFYGEIYGKKIQELTYGLEDIDVRFFDIKNTSNGKYLNHKEFMSMCGNLSLQTVPILYFGKFSKDILKQCTEGLSTVGIVTKGGIKEGCVIKPVEERTEHMGRVILKSINEVYLLTKNRTEFH